MEEDNEIRVRMLTVRKLLELANELLGELDPAKLVDSEANDQDRQLICREIQVLWKKLNCNNNDWGAKLQIPNRRF